MNKIYLFDSSAIIEILKGNEKIIEKYKEFSLITISLVYGEVYYYCLKTSINIEKFKEIKWDIIKYSLKEIEEAMEFLYKKKKEIKDFSFIDAMVYIVAKKNNLVLVTKDYGFNGLDKVEIII